MTTSVRLIRGGATAVASVLALACGEAPADMPSGTQPTAGFGAATQSTAGSSGAAPTSGGTGPTGSGGTGTGGSEVTGTAGTTDGGSSGSSGDGASGGQDGTVGGSQGGMQPGGGTGGEDPGSNGGTGTGPGTLSTPEGTIPNEPQPASKVGLDRSQWEEAIISPTMLRGNQNNQSTVLNGYLMVGGNEEFWFFDISDPSSPEQLSEMKTPTRTGGEAETHSISFARYGDKFYMVTIGGRGVDTWDVTDVRSPRHVGSVRIPGTDYGDYTEAIWGVTWQGQYIYVGATNNGIKVVDAADPSSLSVAGEISTSQYGGVNAGVIDAIGNVLVVTTPKETGGVATLDITDPTKPSRLASFSTDISYIGQFHRRWVFLLSPVRAWDVLSDPRNIGRSSSPVGTLSTEQSEYIAFSDDYMFLGHVRTEIGGIPGASKINVADPTNMEVVERIWGRQNLGGNDDQFVLPLANLVWIGDDQAPYHGWYLAVHDTDPDTKAPVVDTVIPKNEETGVATTSRIGITFSDNIELTTVNRASFIVRPVGGEPLSGRYGVRMGVLNFDPDEPLEPGTTYEVVLPQGGIADYVGNPLASEFKSTFTTN